MGGDRFGRLGSRGRAPSRLLRIAVVDDDDVQRTGLVGLLAEDPEVGAVEHDTIATALARSSWAGIDVAVVHLFRPAPRGDQLAGVEVIERVRRAPLPRSPRLVALCALPDDDAARIRAREAGASDYLHRWWVPSGPALCDAIVRPAAGGVPAVSDPDALVPLGVTHRSRINAAVAAAYAEVLVPDAGWIGPRGRDRDARRARFNEAARLHPVGGDGLEPERDTALPSLRQVQRVVAWAARPVAIPPPGPAPCRGARGAGTVVTMEPPP